MSRNCILCGEPAYGLCDPWEWDTTMHNECHVRLIDRHRIDGRKRGSGHSSVPRGKKNER